MPDHPGPRSLFLRVLLVQAGVLAVLTVATAWLAPQVTWVALAGGSLALAANLVFGVLALTKRRSAGAVLSAFLVAEIGKFFVVVLGFAWLFRSFSEQLHGLNAAVLLGAFAVILGAQWVAPIMFKSAPRR